MWVKLERTVTVAGKTLVEGKDYKLNIRPQSADDDFTYPDSVINATNGKEYFLCNKFINIIISEFHV